MPKFTKPILAIALLAALCVAVSAQSYSVRVTFNTNIRAQPSLDAARLETVPGGTVLEVLDESNRWFRVNRGSASWMANWVPYERVEAMSVAAADNCCGIDRQCQRDQEWIDGYWAFQNGHCQTPETSTQVSEPAPAAAAQPVTDNCCGVDRACQSEQEWVDGFWAFQNGQCAGGSQTNQYASGGANCCDTGWDCQREHDYVYGGWAAQHNRCFPTPYRLPFQSFGPHVDHGHIRITELSPGFTTMVNRGFTLLREHAPNWYAYVNNALTEVRERHCCGTGVYGASGVVVYHHAPHSIRPYILRDDYTMAGTLVHEACHVYQAREGRGVGGDLSWVNEYECELYAWDAAALMGGPTATNPNNVNFHNDPMNRDYWWWTP